VKLQSSFFSEEKLSRFSVSFSSQKKNKVNESVSLAFLADIWRFCYFLEYMMADLMLHLIIIGIL
jgi:hypothetical protein